MNLKWKKIKEKLLHNTYRPIMVKTFLLPTGETMDFDIVHEGETVSIVCITPQNEIILTKEFRPGPEKILLELPGGYKDEKETPQEAAKRELLEETGYTGDLVFLGTTLHDAYSDRIKYNFICLNSKKIQDVDTNEILEVIPMPLEEFRRHVQTGELTDVDTAYKGLAYIDSLATK